MHALFGTNTKYKHEGKEESSAVPRLWKHALLVPFSLGQGTEGAGVADVGAEPPVQAICD